MCMEALKFNAPQSALTTQLSAARYLDTYREQGHDGKMTAVSCDRCVILDLIVFLLLPPYFVFPTVFALAGWAVESNGKYSDIYAEAYCLRAPPSALTTRERAHKYLDNQRATGRKGASS